MTMTDPLALSGMTIDQAELTGDRPITPDDAFRRTIFPSTVTGDPSVKTAPIRFATGEEAIAQLRAELAALTAQRDGLLAMVDQKNSELEGLLLTLRAQVRQDADAMARKDATITELRSQIDKLTTAALEPQPQPPVNVDAIMAMINQQHQLIAKLDQHLSLALGMADYRAALGQLGQ